MLNLAQQQLELLLRLEFEPAPQEKVEMHQFGLKLIHQQPKLLQLRQVIRH